MKAFFNLLAAAILASNFCLVASAPARDAPELTGHVMVGFKTEKTLHREGKDNIAIAASRAEECSSLVATLAKVRDSGCSEIRTEVVYESKGDGGFQVFEVGEGNEDAVIKALTEGANKDRYAFVQPDYIVYANNKPNDPFIDSQYKIETLQLEDAWDISTGSPDITIGVCDTGIQVNHPDLEETRLLSYDAINTKWEGEAGADVMDRHGHGTHVSGSAAAIGNNGIGVTGVGWNFKHRAGKCLNDNGAGRASWINDCVR